MLCLDEKRKTLTVSYLNGLSKKPEPKILKQQLLQIVANNLPSDAEIPTELTPYQIAQIVLKFYPVAMVHSVVSGKESCDLCIYCEDGMNAGLYMSGFMTIWPIVSQYKANINFEELQEILDILQQYALQKIETKSDHLVAIQNGIFNFATNTLLPFSSEYVFLTKLPILGRYELNRNTNMNETNKKMQKYVVLFWNEFKDKFVWNLLPFPFLWDLFRAWIRKTYPELVSMGLSVTVFGIYIREQITPDCGWHLHPSGYRTCINPADRMKKPEPLILEYHLKDWMNPNYHGSNPDNICTPALRMFYRGVLRNESVIDD